MAAILTAGSIFHLLLVVKEPAALKTAESSSSSASTTTASALSPPLSPPLPTAVTFPEKNESFSKPPRADVLMKFVEFIKKILLKVRRI
jgi:hypothetical protein